MAQDVQCDNGSLQIRQCTKLTDCIKSGQGDFETVLRNSSVVLLELIRFCLCTFDTKILHFSKFHHFLVCRQNIMRLICQYGHRDIMRAFGAILNTSIYKFFFEIVAMLINNTMASFNYPVVPNDLFSSCVRMPTTNGKASAFLVLLCGS